MMECGSSSEPIHILVMCVNAISGSLSIVGSSIIIFMILRRGQRRLCRLHNRLLVGSSSIDVLYSFAIGCSFIPSPQLDDCSFGIGNHLSCTSQGFFLTLGLAVPGYTAMLSIYYLVTVVYRQSEEMIAQKFEPYMHAYAVLPPFIWAIIGASKSYFFSQVAQCWIEDPCLSSKECNGSEGFGKGEWLVLASTIWLSFNIIVTLVCMVAIYHKINERVRVMRRYVFVRADAPPSRMEVAAKESARQGLLYMIAFLFTYSWPGIELLFQSIDRSRSSRGLYILTAVFCPLQGFWNFITYIRPRFVKLQQENESLSFLSTMKLIIFTEEVTEPARQRRRQRWRSIRFDPLYINTTQPDIDAENANANDDIHLEIFNEADSQKVREAVNSPKNCEKANTFVCDRRAEL